MEADLGNATEARQRLEALENAAAARGDALIQLYVCRQLLIQLDDEESPMPEGNQEAALLEMLQSYRSRGIRRGEPSVYRLYARFLASEGRLPEAIAMVRQAANLSEQFGWHLHLPRLWMMSADWHSELGQESEAAALWKRIDGLLEAHKDFPEKRCLEVLLAKMQSLASHKKMAAAKAVYEQAAKLVAASSLTAFQVEAFKALDLKALFQLDDDEASAGAVKPVAWADLQPLAVRSVALPGLNASAVYLLSNPGVLPVSGCLTATDPIESSIWREEKGDWALGLKDQAGKSSVRSPVITCEPGQSVSVSLEHAATVEGRLATCELGWQPAVNGKTEGNGVSQWDFGGRTEDGVRVHAALASVTRRNAFYAVPVPQFVQSLATLGQDSQPQNYRLKASSPCWIELSNAADEVLGIDANGNGLFEDVGDVLEADRDANGFPDVALDASRNSQELIIFNVYPSAATSDEPIRLEFQLLSDSGDWETVSISQLK